MLKAIAQEGYARKEESMNQNPYLYVTVYEKLVSSKVYQCYPK